jgi:hypothetical protein
MAAKAKGYAEHIRKHKKTSIGSSRRLGSISTCMMNKSKRSSFKKYRGQGK